MFTAVVKDHLIDLHSVIGEMVVQIEFGGWTADGHLRHSKFCGLYDNKEPRDVVRER